MALPFLIQRINSERGGFLNLDEDELREEIAKEEAGGEIANDEAASPEDGDEKPDRMKELIAAREEMLVQIEYASSQPIFTAANIAIDKLTNKPCSLWILSPCSYRRTSQTKPACRSPHF
jgi:mediator of RNA polymerase II transcription subunit 17